MVNKKEILYCDMDDTLCDYQEQYDKNLELYPDVEYPQSIPTFFYNLLPIADAIESINKLTTKFDVYILTRPSIKNLHCYTEKAMWVKKWLGEEWLERLIISPDKALLRGKWLIDDVEWKKFKGNQIMFKKNSTNWKFILKLWNLND